MTYYSCTDKELAQFGIQEGELAIYTGTVNSRQPATLSPGVNSKNAYVYIWQDGRPRELDACFQCGSAGLDVLEIQTDAEEYTFLRDKPSGYIRQIEGPAKPVTVANIGAIPLRVDTFLGKFMVYAGSMLRLDENAPRREKKKVLLTVSSRYDQPLKSAEIWDGVIWQRLNIREEPFVPGVGGRFAVLDSSAIVQYMEINEKREILMMDSPESDPDYEIYVSVAVSDWVTLRFNRTDYRDGQVVQRSRKIPYGVWGEPVIYDLQKLRESLAHNAVRQCTAELPGVPDRFEPSAPPMDTSLPNDRTEEFAPERRRPQVSDKLLEFLGGEEKSGEQLSKPDQADGESQREYQGCGDVVSSLGELARTYQDVQKTPVPEPPENFPK